MVPHASAPPTDQVTPLRSQRSPRGDVESAESANAKHRNAAQGKAGNWEPRWPCSSASRPVGERSPGARFHTKGDTDTTTIPSSSASAACTRGLAMTRAPSCAKKSRMPISCSGPTFTICAHTSGEREKSEERLCPGSCSA